MAADTFTQARGDLLQRMRGWVLQHVIGPIFKVFVRSKSLFFHFFLCVFLCSPGPVSKFLSI